MTTVIALVGPTYNFNGSNLENAYFVTAQVGVSLLTGSSNSSEFAYSASFGKRFALSEKISWKPEAVISGTAAASDRPVINIVPIQISFFF